MLLRSSVGIPFLPRTVRARSEVGEDVKADPQVVLLGYQANFVIPEKGLFLFDHHCRNTL